MKNGRRLRGLVATLFGVFSVPFLLTCAPTSGHAADTPPKPQHVFIIVLENESYDVTFGPKSPAAFLKALRRQGALLEKYYGTGHYSLDNYIAMVSGQSPNPVTQADCQKFIDFVATGMGEHGQALGQGCVYPAAIRTIADQLDGKGLTWKGYMEDMGNIPSRERQTCGHPAIGLPDNTQKAVPGDQYAARHDPFVYFHSIIDKDNGAYCDEHVVNLRALAADLHDEKTTPNYAFITPNLCHDAHDGGNGKKCVDGQPGGLLSADQFLADIVPKILASPAFKHDGLLIITFDEAEIHLNKKGELKRGDVSACCNIPFPPNIKPGHLRVIFNKHYQSPDKGAGIAGPGGGRIGAILLSPLITPGSRSQVEYNHYSMLRSIEDFFGLDYLGYASLKGLNTFEKDTFWK